MEFGVSGISFARHPWRDFLQVAVRLGVEAIELDTRPHAHCDTWSPDTDPGSVVEELKSANLRVGCLAVEADLVQKDDAALEAEAEKVRGALGLAFGYRAEVVRIGQQRTKDGMARDEMLDSIVRGCRAFREVAEENGMLVCLHPDRDLLKSNETLRGVLAEVDTYNLKVVIDPLALLRSRRDVEVVRTEVAEMVREASHVCLRDGRLDPKTGAVTEVPVGQGDCPVEMVVSEMLVASYYRPFYIEYRGEDDAFESTEAGIDYFRGMPNRLLSEAGLL
jgi:sugar phosphate isomerase/epimerase